jgi:hypothetical protein
MRPNRLKVENLLLAHQFLKPALELGPVTPTALRIDEHDYRTVGGLGGFSGGGGGVEVAVSGGGGILGLNRV